MKPIPPKDIFKLVETSTSDGNSSLRGIINKENVDEAAQMAYSIVTAVEEANMAIEDKQRVFYDDIRPYCELKIKISKYFICPLAHLKNIPAPRVKEQFAKTPEIRLCL